MDTDGARRLNRSSPSCLNSGGSANRLLPRAATGSPSSMPCFPSWECVLGPLTEKQQQLVQTLEVIRIEQMVPPRFRVPGRPPKDRAAMARALVAKAVYDMPTTRVLLDRLVTDVALRRICGWERKSEVAERVGLLTRLRRVLGHAVAPARARSADREHPPRPVGGPPLPRLDGHRGPREAGREAEGTSAAQAANGDGRRRVRNDRRSSSASTGSRP